MSEHDEHEGEHVDEVAVVGAGVAGLTLAISLRRRGVRARLVEAAPELLPLGAGVQLGPNATRVLTRLGLGPALGERGVEIDARLVHDPSGLVVQHERLGGAVSARYGAPYLAIHRGALQEVLVAHAAGTPLELGDRVVAVRQRTDGAEVVRRSGRTTRHGLVVGADGLRSTTRRLAGTDVPVPSGRRVLRGLVRAAGQDPVVRVWAGPDRHAVVYPIGQDLLNVVAVLPDPGTPAGGAVGAGDLVAAFAGWDAVLLDLLRAVPEVTAWPLEEHGAVAHWSTPSTTLVGDAAHPMLPFLAQGAAQAVEDAAALALCLWNSPDDQPGALERYERVRRARTTQVQERSRHHLRDVRQRPAQGPDAIGHLDWLYGYDAELEVLIAPDEGRCSA